VAAPLPLTIRLPAQAKTFPPLIVVHTMGHKGMRRIERALNEAVSKALFALSHIASRKVQIFENSLGVRPLLEQIIVLEKMIVTGRRRAR